VKSAVRRRIGTAHCRNHGKLPSPQEGSGWLVGGPAAGRRVAGRAYGRVGRPRVRSDRASGPRGRSDRVGGPRGRSDRVGGPSGAGQLVVGRRVGGRAGGTAL